MTREEIVNSMSLQDAIQVFKDTNAYGTMDIAKSVILKALEQEPIDKFAMMHEIYMEGVNMSGEYQGCWVRFKDIEKIVDKYIAESKVIYE